MEDQAQKMMALKKAYANIILSTAKEAASRIMASERRAVQFQQELASTKDEALRMLVRLKQMIDAKTAEAETATLNNQRKIEELEAQLNEAEDVITDLRAELKQVWLKLEKTKNTQNHSLEVQIKRQVASVELEKTMNTQNQLLEEQIKKQAASVEESAKQDVTLPIPIQQREYGTVPCGVKNVPSNQNVLDDKCCNAMKQAELCCISNLVDYYAHNSNLPSIIMRGKEPELYKNGCTQRIRALEGKVLNDKLLTRDEQNGHFGVNSGFAIKDNDKEVAKFSTLSSSTKKMNRKKHVKRHGIQKGKTFSYLSSCFIPCCKGHIDEDYRSDKVACSLPSFKSCTINKSRRTKRGRPVRKKSSVHECCKPSFTPKQCSSVSNNDKCCEDEYEKKPVPHLTDTEPVHGSSSDEPNSRTISKFELKQETAERDEESLDTCILENLAGGNEMKLADRSGKMEAEVVLCTNTDLEDTKAFEENNESSGQADDRRLLKYTFCRKRKKESLDNPEEKTNSEESTVKRRVDEKQNGISEPQKSSLMDESSRDSRRLAQVARQLISLSAKRW